jgi:hypothetical protein
VTLHRGRIQAFVIADLDGRGKGPLLALWYGVPKQPEAAVFCRPRVRASKILDPSIRGFPKKVGMGDRPPRTKGQNLRKGDRSDGERIGGL